MERRTAAPRVLYADNHLLVVDKPANMPVQPDSSEVTSLYDWAKEWIRNEKNKVGGDVFCGIVHRLDRDVTGVIVLARTSKAAGRLSEQWRNHQVQKEYRTIVSPPPAKSELTLRHYLRKDPATRYVSVFDREEPGSALAITRYVTVRTTADVALLAVYPETGRPHQIRAQLAQGGTPIVGDRKYGGRPCQQGLALHASTLTFLHPTTQQPQRFEAPLPAWWNMVISMPTS